MQKPLFEVVENISADAWWTNYQRLKKMFCEVCVETTPHELIGQALNKGVVSYVLYRCKICKTYKEVKL